MGIQQVYHYYDRDGQEAGDGYRFCPRCQQALEQAEIGGRVRLVCPGCGFIRFRNPAPAVSVLVVDGERVLLGRRASEPGCGKGASVSGYVEYEEDFMAAARREVSEEIGLEVQITLIVNVASSFLAPGYHFLSVYLLGEVVGGTLQVGDDMDAVAWFPSGGPFPELAFLEDAEVLQMNAQHGLAGIRPG